MNRLTATQAITLDSLILEVVESHPQTVSVFSERNMACPGCQISPFHTVAHSAREYGLPADELLQALNDALVSLTTSC
jgi:hybrid cluster-associated redox disulfide protein